jgi:hypothetical protein
MIDEVLLQYDNSVDEPPFTVEVVRVGSEIMSKKWRIANRGSYISPRKLSVKIREMPNTNRELTENTIIYLSIYSYYFI